MKQEIASLQELMKQQKLDYYYVVSQDDHNSEYVAEHYRCREYLSGFTGSAGSLLITANEAMLWTDGRYHLQAEQQLAGSGITLMKYGNEGVPDVQCWLSKHGISGGAIGYDGRTVSAQFEQRIKSCLKDKDFSFYADCDLAGSLWQKAGVRPKLAFHKITDYPICYSGESREDKCRRFCDWIQEKGIEYYVVTELDEIAWLMNLRGCDIASNPVFLSYLIASKDSIKLYVNTSAIEEELLDMLHECNVSALPYDRFYQDIDELKGAVHADINSVNARVWKKVLESGGEHFTSPIKLWKGIKNKTEIEGERKAHLRDGVALVNFLYWLKHLKKNRNGYFIDEQGEQVTELLLSKRLEEERAKQGNYMEPSFDPIVAFGEHGAIVHYSATEESNVPIREGGLLLMDTGAQYLEGTTDITRTIALGDITPRMKELYTAVLCGNLELSNVLFAKGCRGENLDIVARTPLWKLGYDFNHGTGHGVGCYLNVHEAPVSIRTRIYDDDRNSAEFKPGMIVSNEPGVYVNGEFGIRLENMMLCVEKSKTDYQEFYAFEPLTLVPWDKDALLPDEMTEQQKEWLNYYQQLVYNSLSGQLEPEVDDWLFSVTRPVH